MLGIYFFHYLVLQLQLISAYARQWYRVNCTIHILFQQNELVYNYITSCITDVFSHTNRSQQGENADNLLCYIPVLGVACNSNYVTVQYES